MDIIIPPRNHTSHLSVILLWETEESRCEECGGEISGTAFTCNYCKVWKHISCADKLNRDPPLEIIHLLHLQHRLQLEWSYHSDFICDKCLYISTGYIYRCFPCNLILDLTCASSVSGQLPKDQEPLRFKDGKKKTIFHYSHSHDLEFFKYRKVREEDYDCFWCERHLLPSEVCYGCTGCKFYLHQVCSDKFPRTLSHSFHPNHPLRVAYSTSPFTNCNGCLKLCDTDTPLYVCEMCSFRLDFDCAKLSPSLKLDCHHHLLTFFKDFNNEGVWEYPQQYLYCKLQLHINMNERNPKDPMYYCQSCTFIVHIQCILDQDKVALRKVPSSSPPPMENKALFVEQNEGSHVIRTLSLFQPTTHPHGMYKITAELGEKIYCNGCRLAQPIFALKEAAGIYFMNLALGCHKRLESHFIQITCWLVACSLTVNSVMLALALWNYSQDSFIEDDSGKYYCDFCEEERNPNDDIYYCEECNGQTIAHIECVLTEVEDNIEIRKNIHEERFRKELKNLVARFMKFLSNECRPPIEDVIQAGVVPRFVELLGSPSDYVREQAVLVLGNIAAVSLRCRDLVLGHGALLPLLALLNEPVSCSMLRNATWTLSRFCKPPFDQVKLVLPTLARLIHSKDEVILAKACRALSYLSNGTNDKIQAVIEAGVLGRLAELLMHPSPSVITPALYIVKHIFTGNDVQIQAIIEANIIAPLLHLLQNDDKYDIWIQATQAISNAISGGTHDLIRFLVSQGCIVPLYNFLYDSDPEVVTVGLQGLENILKVGEADKNMGITGGVNLHAQLIDAALCRERIKDLRYHGNTEISEKAVEVLETYCDYVREQAVLALGNIAAVSLRCRDLVLAHHGALLTLLALLNEPVSRSMLRNATWTLSRFCKPPFDQVKLVLPILACLIHSKDDVVLAKAYKALPYLFDGTNDKIQAVIEAGVLGRLVELLIQPSPSVITSALYTVRNIVTGDNVQTQAIIEANIIAPLVDLLQNDKFNIQNQVAKAISNATFGGTHDQIRFLVSQGCIKPLCDLLYYSNLEVVTVCLQGLENILKVGEADKNMGIIGGVNLYAQMIDAALS
ncbi:hypothetical protein GOBAR_AA32214 [Gossypium barbadense]|uniref:DC1 domain-containing protein n=1 Tax=Gossypium barbadense TaxID=3634 RepID=A0A2P5WBK5_GOSBA|nr:hypothetical protein GOBAR_AA32214 [Gossypium barbadense]